MSRRPDQAGLERAAQSAAAARELDPTDRQILDFAHMHFNYQGTKDQSIRDTFEITPTAFAQRLNALLDNPHALAYAPMTVNRLRRQRATTR